MAVLKDPAKQAWNQPRCFLYRNAQTSPDSAVYTSFLVHLLDSRSLSLSAQRDTRHPDRQLSGQDPISSSRECRVAWNKSCRDRIVSKSMTGGSAPVNATSFAAGSLASLAGYDKSFILRSTFKAGFSDDADIQSGRSRAMAWPC